MSSSFLTLKNRLQNVLHLNGRAHTDLNEKNVNLYYICIKRYSHNIELHHNFPQYPLYSGAMLEWVPWVIFSVSKSLYSKVIQGRR